MRVLRSSLFRGTYTFSIILMGFYNIGVYSEFFTEFFTEFFSVILTDNTHTHF